MSFLTIIQKARRDCSDGYVSSKNYSLFEMTCKANGFNYPIYYDRKEEFAKTNEFNLNKTMTIFLLDSYGHEIELYNIDNH